MARTKKSLEEKIKDEMPEFAGEVAGLSVEQLNARLAEQAKAAEWNDQSKENDEALLEAQATASELGAPYRDAKKAIKLRSRYLIKLIQEKGGA